MNSNWVDSEHPATLATVDPSVGYYPNGTIAKITYGNGLTKATVIERRLQPCVINVNSSGSGPAVIGGCAGVSNPPSGTIQGFAYAYGTWGATNNGDVTTMLAAGTQNFSRTYAYDQLDRLSTISAPGDSCSGLSWTYDVWGNRTDQSVTSGICNTFHVSANTKNQLIDPPYQYDAAGNMIQDASHTYTYDAENRLVSIDGGSATYLYDAEGHRVRKSVGAAQTHYIYNLSDQVVSEVDQNNVWKNVYLRLNGKFVAQYTIGSPRTQFVQADHLASTRILTRLDRSVASTMDYYPFGEETSFAAAVPVTNPGFESGGSGWALGFWGCTSSVTTAQAHSGSSSLAQTGSVTGGSYQDMGGVVSGSTYQVSMWIRADAGTTAQAMLWLHDTTGANSVQSSLITPSTAWQQVTLNFTATNTNLMRIHLYFGAGSGTIYYDDIQVQMLNPVGDTSLTTMKFTGDERDSESNLDHTQFRQYSSSLGRWMTPDPAGLAAVDPSNPQSWNRYAYVLNNPTNLIDPLGLTDCPQGKTCGDPSNQDPNWADWSGLFGRDLLGCGWADFWGGDCATANRMFGGSLTRSGAIILPYPWGQCMETTGDYVCWNNVDVNYFLYGGRGNGSSWGTFAKEFFKLSGGPGNVPTCAEVALKNIGQEFIPFSPSGASVIQATAPAAQAMAFNTAVAQTEAGIDAYIAAKGLTVPLRSAVVRATAAQGAKSAVAAGLRANFAVQTAAVDYAAFTSMLTTMDQARRGTCAAAFPIF